MLFAGCMQSQMASGPDGSNTCLIIIRGWPNPGYISVFHFIFTPHTRKEKLQGFEWQNSRYVTLKKKKKNKLVVNSRLCYHVNTGALGWRHPFLPHVDMLCERAVKMCLLAKIKKKERKNDIPGVSYYEKLSREIDFECRHTTISGQQTQRRKGTKGMA